MRIERGEPVPGVPPAIARRMQRLLRVLDAAPDLRTIRSIPSVPAVATLVVGECSIPIHPGWKLCFIWQPEDAWSVRAEEES